MINRQSIGDVALPTLSIMLPFAIIVGQLGFDPCRWWIVYCTAAAVAMGLAVGTSRMRKTSGARPTTSPPWTFFWIGLAALTAVQGGFYSQFRNQCPVCRTHHPHRHVPGVDRRTDSARSGGSQRMPTRAGPHIGLGAHKSVEAERPPGRTRGPSCLRWKDAASGSRCSRSRPAAPQHRCWNRSRGCSTDPRRTGSCTRRPAPLRSAAPKCCGSG